MDLTPYLQFNLQFDLTGYPTLNISDVSAYPIGVVGQNVWYELQQPDGINLPIGSNLAPNANPSVALRLGSDQKYQKGFYTVKMNVVHEGNLSVFTRTFDFQYQRPTMALVQDFDVFTPKLLYRDQTIINPTLYNTVSSVIAWQAVIATIATIVSASSVFDMSYNGNYYSAAYDVTYSRTLSFVHQTYAWLTVLDKLTSEVTFNIVNPPTINQMLATLQCMHAKILGDACNCGCEDALQNYLYAQSLLSNILNGISLAQYTGLDTLLQQFINKAGSCLTQPAITNAAMSAYVFTGGGTGGTGIPDVIYEFDVTGTITNFTLPLGSVVNKIISVKVDGIERKCVTGLDTDVPADGTFIYVASLLKFNYGGTLENLQWIKIIYQ